MKQVIIVRNDLKCRKGKLIAQGCHASLAFSLDYHKSKMTLPDKIIEWIATRQKKIVVRAESEEELTDLYKAALDAGLLAYLITDSGLTEFNGPTKTAVAIGPDEDEKIDAVTGNLKLS